MPEMPATFVVRAANRILRWSIRLYPEEKRAWGEAILAEAASITTLGAALYWTIGGLMVALRVFCSRLFQRSSKNPPRHETSLLSSPRGPAPLPWKTALVCLAIFSGLLCSHDLRQAFRVTFSVSREMIFPRDDSATWERIGREAESKGDSDGMAVAAVRISHCKDRLSNEADILARLAVRKNQSLVWIYYALSARTSDMPTRNSSRSKLLNELQRWEPNNAVPYLALADEAAFNYEHGSDRREPKQQTVESASYSTYLLPAVRKEIDKRGPEWRAWMDRAFAAPSYDDYMVREINLDHQIARRYTALDPLDTMTASLTLPIPNLLDIRIYADLRIAQAQEAEQAGRWEEAANLYWSVVRFGQRMRSGGRRQPVDGYIADIIGNGLEELSFQRLPPVLMKLGKVQEADFVASAVQEEKLEEQASRYEYWRTRAFFGSSALLIYVWAFLAALCSLAIVTATLMFVARRAPRLVRFIMLYLFPLLALSCAGLLVSYRPYADAFNAFLDNPSGLGPQIEFYSLFDMPGQIIEWFRSDQSHIFYWSMVIAIGGVIIAWRLLRAAQRRLA